MGGSVRKIGCLSEASAAKALVVGEVLDSMEKPRKKPRKTLGFPGLFPVFFCYEPRRYGTTDVLQRWQLGLRCAIQSPPKSWFFKMAGSKRNHQRTSGRFWFLFSFDRVLFFGNIAKCDEANNKTLTVQKGQIDQKAWDEASFG